MYSYNLGLRLKNYVYGYDAKKTKIVDKNTKY